MADYLPGIDLKNEMIKCHSVDRLTDEGVRMLTLMVDHIQRPFPYVLDQDREDCRSNAIEQFLKNWRMVSPTRAPSSMFSYFTQMHKNAIYAGWNKLIKYRADFSTSYIFQDDI